MSIWAHCDADGCTERATVSTGAGYEPGDSEVYIDDAQWYEQSTLAYNEHRLDLCPKHIPRGAAVPWWVEPR